MRVVLKTVVVTAFLVVLVAPAALANCGAENCPLNPQGLEASQRPWSFDVGYQYVDQDVRWNGTTRDDAVADVGHITELFTRTHQWSFNARGRVLPRFKVVAMLPYVQREHEHELQHHPGYFIPSHWQYEGVGDATMIVHWEAWGSIQSGIGALTLQGGAKLPTGKRHVEEIDGDEPEPPARPGTGSTDGLFGVQLMRHWSVAAPGKRTTSVPLVFSVLGRWNGEGTDGYRMGNELHPSLSSSYEIWNGVALLGQLNAVFHGRDQVGNTDAEPHHTGGTSVYATPGLRLALPANTALYGYWQARIYERTNGPQLVAPAHLIVGASFGLGS